MKQHFGKYLGPTLIDEAQPITAWRTWRLRDFRLVGTWATTTEWTAGGGVTAARCLAKKNACNLTMEPRCNCGLWASVALSNLLKHGAVGLYPYGVLGRVHLWGFVHVYSFGFRAAMGRPLDCWLGSSAGRYNAERISRAYKMPVSLGLPVEIIADPEMLAAPRVLAATRRYQIEQAKLPAPAIRALPPAPSSANGRHRCSGCGTVGTRIDHCPKCRARRGSTTTLLKAAVPLT